MSEVQIDHRKVLGELLRRCRLGSGLSGRRLGTILGFDQSRVSRIESGRTRISQGETERWLRETGASTAIRVEAARLVEAALSEPPSWRNASPDGWTAHRTDLAAIESEASHILIWQESFIPDLLQTPTYMRQMIHFTASQGKRQIADRVSAQVARQDALYGSVSRIEVLIRESALRQHVGNDFVMIDQLSRVISLAQQKRVSIGILTEGEAVDRPLYPNFTVYGAPRSGAVDLVAVLGESRPQSRRSVVQRYIDQFRSHQSRSLQGDQAITLVEGIICALATRQAGPTVSPCIRDGE